MEITPRIYLQFAKDIEPEIFENKTPKLHLELLDFIFKEPKFKAIAVFRGAGKTTLLNKIYTTSQIYFKQEPFILVCSSVEDKALSFLDAVKKSIDKAATKGYALARGKVWKQDTIEVIVNAGMSRGGKSIEKICRVATMSAGQDPRGYIVDNVRPTLLIVDDLESNSGKFAVTSKNNRHNLKRWFYADLLPTLHPTKGRCIILGTIIHDDSILNNIIHSKEDNEYGDEFCWDKIKYPIIQNGKSAWVSRFSLQFILSKKAEFKTKGLENEFYQEYMCAPIDPEKVLFKREFFRYFDGLEYDLGSAPKTISVTDGVNTKTIKTRSAKFIKFKNELIELGRCRIFTTVDLASATGRDQTAMVTCAIDDKNRIFVIDICSGHWTPFEKSVELVRVFMSFTPERIGIEKAGMQNDFFYTIDTIQKLTGVRLPVEGLSHQGRDKNTRIANLEPYYRTGQIYHNATIANTQELEAQLVSFDEEVESKSDDLMDALAYVLQYLVGRSFYQSYEPSYDDEIQIDEWA